MKKTTLMTVVSLTLIGVQAGEVKVRTYASRDGSGPQAENPVVVRTTKQMDPPAFVGEQPVAFALMPQVETPYRSMDSSLFRFNLLVGAHRCAYIFDLGVIGNISDYEMNGLGIAGVFNLVGTSSGAFHFAGICNYSGWDMGGCQLSAAWNWTEGSFSGLQLGLVNKAGRLDGLQVGGLNMAEQGSGVQIGVVNTSDRLEGLQIGVVNFNRDSAVPFMPVVNFAF